MTLSFNIRELKFHLIFKKQNLNEVWSPRNVNFICENGNFSYQFNLTRNLLHAILCMGRERRKKAEQQYQINQFLQLGSVFQWEWKKLLFPIFTK